YRGARVSKVVERNIDIPLRRVSKLNATSTGAGTRSVERSTDVRAKLPKIAAPHALSEQLRSRSSCIHILETLIVGEEEKLVLNNRSADGYSKLVVAKFGFEEGPVSRMTRDDMPRSVLVRSHTPRPAVGWKVGIEFVIAEKLVNRSVKAIRPSFGRYTDDAALVVAEFCRGVLGDDVEISDGVDIRHERGLIVLVLAIENAVEEVLIRLFTVAVDKGAGIAIQVVRFVNSVGIVCRSSWREQAQLQVVAPSHRHLGHCVCANESTDLGAFGL